MCTHVNVAYGGIGVQYIHVYVLWSGITEWNLATLKYRHTICWLASMNGV